MPGWLCTQIRPPCSSTNFRHNVRLSPVPSALFPDFPTCRNSSKTASRSSDAIPIPMSVTAPFLDLVNLARHAPLEAKLRYAPGELAHMWRATNGNEPDGVR